MAHSTTNSLLQGFSGKFGNEFVIKNRNGKTIIAKMPRKTSNPATAKQKDVKNRFILGVNYAKCVIGDPVLKELYRQNLPKKASVYRAAMKDYLNAPTIERIDCMKYCGNPAEKITVIATDCFMVTRVKIQILDKAGKILEEGNLQTDFGNYVWQYTTTVAIADLTGVTIKATAYDNPGNEGTAEVML